MDRKCNTDGGISVERLVMDNIVEETRGAIHLDELKKDEKSKEVLKFVS